MDLPIDADKEFLQKDLFNMDLPIHATTCHPIRSLSWTSYFNKIIYTRPNKH
jgi:hypothetical protein